MVEFDPLPDTPFEEASNRSFLALLLAGVLLFALVALVGRSTITTGAVVLYLFLIPAYVAVRARTWDGKSAGAGGEPGDDESGPETADPPRG